jgi:hypothetical protein
MPAPQLRRSSLFTGGPACSSQTNKTPRSRLSIVHCSGAMEEKMAADALATALSTYTSLQGTASAVLQSCWQSKVIKPPSQCPR